MCALPLPCLLPPQSLQRQAKGTQRKGVRPVLTKSQQQEKSTHDPR